MQYKTTYFVLSLNKDISSSIHDLLHSQKMLEECHIKDDIIKEIDQLEDEVYNSLIEFFNTVKINRAIITDTKVITGEKKIKNNLSKGPIYKHKFKRITDTLTKEEKEEILRQLQPKDILR